MPIKEAMTILKNALKDDDGYYESWKANIAVHFQDECNRSNDLKDIHGISNRAADNFLKHLISQVSS